MSRSEAERLRYTRTYVIESGCGDPLDDIWSDKPPKSKCVA